MKKLFLVSMLLLSLGFANAQTTFSTKDIEEISELKSSQIKIYGVEGETETTYFLGGPSWKNGIMYVPLGKGEAASVQALEKLMDLINSDNGTPITKVTDVDKIKIEVFRSPASSHLICEFQKLSKGKEYPVAINLMKIDLNKALEYFGADPKNSQYKKRGGVLVY